MDDWTLDHDKLKDSLEKEVSILRELLANLFQEEVFLTKKDPKGIYLIHEDRSTLLKSLHLLRKQRHQLTADKKLDLESLLTPENENTPHILSLREQMRTLFEKMNDQKERNHHLHGLQKAPLPKPLKKRTAINTLEK